MAASLLEKAVDLYRGVYLPDQPYQAWAITARERFSVLFLRAADQLAALYLIQGKYRETVAICERILAQDSCWERAYRQLMTAYHHLGDHGQVARVYQRCVRRLREELDVSPAESTTALHEQLLGDNNI